MRGLLRDLALAVSRQDVGEVERIVPELVPPAVSARVIELFAGRRLGPYPAELARTFSGAELEDQMNALAEYRWEELERTFPDVPFPAEHMSVEEHGAIYAICAVGVIYNHPLERRETMFPGLNVDGVEFVSRAIEALPTVLPPAQEIYADRLSEACDDRDRLIVREIHVPLIESLMARYPEHEQVLKSLLRNIALTRDLSATLAEAWDSLLLGEEQPNPKNVLKVLTRLFETEDPQAVLQLADALYFKEGMSDDVKVAIGTAVATAAPVELAAGFLTKVSGDPNDVNGGPRLMAAMYSYAQREGAGEAMMERYYTLREFDIDSQARVMQVVAMQGLGTEQLLAIALDDPSPDVVGQAFLTLTIEETHPTPQILTELLNASEQGRLQAGLAFDALGNLALRAKNAGDESLLREVLREWTRFTQTALALPEGDPRSIYALDTRIETLRAYLPPRKFQELFPDYVR